MISPEGSDSTNCVFFGSAGAGGAGGNGGGGAGAAIGGVGGAGGVGGLGVDGPIFVFGKHYDKYKSYYDKCAQELGYNMYIYSYAAENNEALKRAAHVVVLDRDEQPVEEPEAYFGKISYDGTHGRPGTNGERGRTCS